ncbi:MAG: hypothetical protein U0L62_03735 [Paludibacteraceae bacterium]|nr:hypothetical protein [Paludibacteraceae bacterium]
MWSQSLYSDGSSSGRYVRWYDSSKSMVGTESIYTVSANVIQSPANAVYARFMWYQASSFNSIDEIIAREPQLELGSTATAYEPYQGSTYTTSLGQTVYGGTLDMVSGVLTVDKAMVTLDGSETWNVNSATSGLYYTTIANLKDNGLAISNAFEQTTVAGANMANGQFKLVAPNLVNIKTEHTTVTDWKTWLSSNNVQLCYELATPQTYTLTPQQIKTLVGTNNVWASSGDIVNITFTYGGLLSELPSDATSVVGKCYCDVEQNGVSSMPFTLNVKKNERES